MNALLPQALPGALSFLIESERGFNLLFLTRFLHASRYQLRSKTLWPALEDFALPRPLQRKNGGGSPAVLFLFFCSRSAQELKHALLRLVGERQRGHGDRLAGRQRLAVGRFLVGIGQRQVRRTGLQHVDQVLVEVLTDLHDREVRTERRSFRA